MKKNTTSKSAPKSAPKAKPAPKTAAEKDSASKKNDHNFLVVGLGASAGGVKALQEFFSTMPPNSGMAFVVILHLSPEHESNLAEIIQTRTTMTVAQVTKTVQVEPNHVYVIPPTRNLVMTDGVITTKASKTHGNRVAIDIFFRSLAEAYGKNAVCVVLSGTGTDGTLGLKRIKESNGFAVVQDPSDAEYDSMPRSAISTQLVDWILSIKQMPEKLINFRDSSERLHLTNGDDGKIAKKINADETLREIITLLRVRTGHDFSSYKTPTLVRRIARHLQIHDLEDIPSFLNFLRQNPGEIQSLLKNLLINVTNFFRDRAAWEIIEREVVPKLFAGKKANQTVRVWSVGCASGEEAYTIAMLLSEYAYHQSDPPKIQVFATDVDDEAIGEAREHRYPESIEADVSPERLKRFFVREGAYYRIKKELRELILFAPHNVLRDPPFSRLDFVVCRNVLIYLNRPTQERLMEIFHFALLPEGYLFLGSSESAESAVNLFSTVNKKQRVYSRRQGHQAQALPPQMPLAGKWQVTLPETRLRDRERVFSLGEMHYKILERFAPPSILVNQDFEIQYMSETAGRFLHFKGGEVTSNILKLVNTDLLPDLRAALFAARNERKSVEFTNIRAKIGGADANVDITVRAAGADDKASDFLLVIFQENSASKQVSEGDEGKKDKSAADQRDANESVVRRLEEDLLRTKSQLRVTIEQHEVSIEELKASNEELQAINEELRSASEELETSKEELQSVNEELTTVNQELKEKMDESNSVNSDLINLMSSTNIATIFLDRGLNIKRFTPPVEKFFNIKARDVGRPLAHFTHLLDYEGLADDAETVLRSLMPLEREITDKKSNRTYIARFLPYRTVDNRIDGVVLNFLDNTESKIAEERLRQSDQRFRMLVESASDYAIFMLDENRLVTSWNAGAEHIFGFKEKEIIGKSGDVLFTPQDREKGIPEWEVKTAAEQGRAEDERWHMRGDGTRFFASGVLMPLQDGGRGGFVKIARDQTERLKAQTAMQDKQMLSQLVATQEDERRRIAREIHDHIGQQMTVLRLKLDAVKKLCGDDEIICAEIDDVQKITEKLDKEVDFLAWELRPAALDDLGLRVTLGNFVEEWSRHTEIKSAFHASGLVRTRLPFEVETNLYRIAQEALNNIHKHAKANSVSVLLEKRGNAITLIIEDDGIGFNAADKRNRTKGIGLIGMSERAKICGGKLEIESAKGKGTTVFARIPTKK